MHGKFKLGFKNSCYPKNLHSSRNTKASKNAISGLVHHGPIHCLFPVQVRPDIAILIAIAIAIAKNVPVGVRKT